MQGTNLSHATLEEADLRQANLYATKFYRTNVTGAHFSHASCGETIFAKMNLREARFLETVQHMGPSSIDFDTLVLSGRQIPQVFLKGAGLPDTVITYARSLTENPVQFYSCFISHSTKDQEFANRLYADLQNKGVRCWFAPHDIRGGRKLYEQIDEAIHLYDRLLLILSEESMNSEWVKTEITSARRKELYQGRQVLFPITLVPFSKVREWSLFDCDTGKDLAREIREYFIPDFSNWKDHDLYQRACQRLVKDLAAQGIRAD